MYYIFCGRVTKIWSPIKSIFILQNNFYTSVNTKLVAGTQTSTLEISGFVNLNTGNSAFITLFYSSNDPASVINVTKAFFNGFRIF